MKKQLLGILAIVACAIGMFDANAACSNGMCGRVRKPAVAKPAVVKTAMKKAPATKTQVRKPAPRCKNGMCSRR